MYAERKIREMLFKTRQERAFRFALHLTECLVLQSSSSFSILLKLVCFFIFLFFFICFLSLPPRAVLPTTLTSRSYV